MSLLICFSGKHGQDHTAMTKTMYTVVTSQLKINTLESELNVMDKQLQEA
jgi:hypothetical protein